MSSSKIFIVEDDAMYGRILSYHLSQNPDNQIEMFVSGKDCISNMYQKPDIITLDYSLPDLSGFEVLNKIKKVAPDTPVIIISGQEDISTAVELLKAGAYDYIVKNDDAKSRLWNTIKNVQEHLKLRKEVQSLRAEVVQKYEFSNIIKGNSAAIKRVFKLMDKAIQTNITVSITGETGTGKEVVAKAVHFNSGRRKQPFIVVNVSAIPEELIESEMFGHEKGSFTGANARRIGKFEEANGGTLFLDEIGEMSMNMQSKLLRVLQEKELTRVGGNGLVKIDCRIIIATHRNLQEEVKKGNFREDLYYRLLGLPIELPPLRDRGNDRIILAKYFMEQFCKENGIEMMALTKKASKKLIDYPFPGNVRELKAIIELASVMANGGIIDEEDITFHSNSSSYLDILDNEYTLQEINNRIIRSYLDRYNGNIVKVAKKLDIGKSTIYRLKKNGGV
ncbi:MAG: sigma-54-dependent Fis family transcriptional regulator [Bacteroidales bacterium]|nr:sigma-54-dependent Fis family transcriptional regulator [Bacteroidales bacterium]